MGRDKFKTGLNFEETMKAIVNFKPSSKESSPFGQAREEFKKDLKDKISKSMKPKPSKNKKP